MDEIDYARRYWYLVEVGHADGVPDYPRGKARDVLKFQPDGEPMFSQVVLFADRGHAERVAAAVDTRPVRRKRGMRLEVHAAADRAALADLLDDLREMGVYHVTFTAPDRGDATVPAELAAVGLRSG